MAITNTRITTADTDTVIFTSVASGSIVGNAITTMIFCNTNAYDSANPTANQALLTIYAVPSGSSAGVSTMIINKTIVPAGETVSFEQEKMVLGNNDAIYAKSSLANAITATISTLAV